MKSQLVFFLCLPVLGVASFAVCQSNSAVTSKSQTTATGTIQLTPIKQLRRGVDAWPLIVNPSTAAETRVNATLTQLNLKLTQDLSECDQNYLAWFKELGEAAQGKPSTSGDWERKVKVTMSGPRFLSIMERDEVFCGGAHPDTDIVAIVFDMTTGEPVNWSALLPKSAKASVYRDTVSDGSTVEGLIFPDIQKIYIAAADAECKDIFQDPHAFLFWPDAKSGTLAVQVFDLPQVVQACAKEIGLTMEQARKLGFDESLLSAIEHAHRRIAATPKP